MGTMHTLKERAEADIPVATLLNELLGETGSAGSAPGGREPEVFERGGGCEPPGVGQRFHRYRTC